MGVPGLAVLGDVERVAQRGFKIWETGSHLRAQPKTHGYVKRLHAENHDWMIKAQLPGQNDTIGESHAVSGYRLSLALNPGAIPIEDPKFSGTEPHVRRIDEDNGSRKLQEIPRHGSRVRAVPYLENCMRYCFLLATDRFNDFQSDLIVGSGSRADAYDCCYHHNTIPPDDNT